MPKMITIEETVEIKAPSSKIFDFISKPQNMAMVIPHVIRNYNVSKGPIKPGWKFDWEFSMMGVPLKGKWVLTKYSPPMVYEAKTEGMAKSEWKYGFSEKGQKTKLTLSVTYTMPPAVASKFVESIVKKMNEKDLKKYLENLKIIFEN